MAVSSFEGFELEMTTEAPYSNAPSATAKPMPEVPPSTKTFLSASFEVNFVWFGSLAILGN